MITKNYIKMCEQAGEIQKACKNVAGDWFYSIKLNQYYINNHIGEGWKHYINLIWLPTQEQLFVMVNFDKLLTFEFSSHKETRTLYIMRIDGTCSLYKNDNFKGCILQYIMHEKYNKTWTGEKWVKAE